MPRRADLTYWAMSVKSPPESEWLDLGLSRMLVFTVVQLDSLVWGAKWAIAASSTWAVHRLMINLD